MQVKSVFVIHGPGVALLRGQWKLTGTGPDGQPVTMIGQSVEVARQQPTGEWRFAVDHPFGAD
jgi:ketosteroid isomerase-like protein